MQEMRGRRGRGSRIGWHGTTYVVPKRAALSVSLLEGASQAKLAYREQMQKANTLCMCLVWRAVTRELGSQTISGHYWRLDWTVNGRC